jgi:hypothetical protein
MKIKLLVIIAFLVVLNPIKAQSKMCMCSADSGIFFPQYEIGLSSNIMFEYPLSKTIVNGFMVKKHFPKFILRAGVNQNSGPFEYNVDGNTYGSKDSGTFKLNTIRVGIEKVFFPSKLSPYVAADLFYAISSSEGIYADWGGFRGTYMERSYNKVSNRIGVMPSFGIKYRPISQLSFGIETNFTIYYYNNKLTDLSNQIIETKSGMNGEIVRSALFTINYHLFTK